MTGAGFEGTSITIIQYGNIYGTGWIFYLTDMVVTKVTHDEAVDVTYSNITGTQVTIQVTPILVLLI